MSYDLALPTVCNHRIARELVTLGADLRSLRVAQPMTSTSTVMVYASDDLVSPTSYSVITDPKGILINAYKMVYFNFNWRSPDDTFEISYSTFENTCYKCGGGGFLDDISYNSLGGLAVNQDENLLLQNLEKFTVTEAGSNIFHTYIGTSLVKIGRASCRERV